LLHLCYPFLLRLLSASFCVFSPSLLEELRLVLLFCLFSPSDLTTRPPELGKVFRPVSSSPPYSLVPERYPSASGRLFASPSSPSGRQLKVDRASRRSVLVTFSFLLSTCCVLMLDLGFLFHFCRSGLFIYRFLTYPAVLPLLVFLRDLPSPLDCSSTLPPLPPQFVCPQHLQLTCRLLNTFPAPHVTTCFLPFDIRMTGLP